MTDPPPDHDLRIPHAFANLLGALIRNYANDPDMTDSVAHLKRVEAEVQSFLQNPDDPQLRKRMAIVLDEVLRFLGQ